MDESRLLRLNVRISLSLSRLLQICGRECIYKRENCNFIDCQISCSDKLDEYFISSSNNIWMERKYNSNGDFNDFVTSIDWTWAKNKRDNYPRQ